MRIHHRILQRGFLAYSRLSRGMTLGVRAMLVKGDQILLVKHSYMPGWYLPGGGVEAGETLRDALEREIAEEAGAALTGPAQFFGIYRNARADPRDHVGLFVCREWDERFKARGPSREIADVRLFPLDALPADATPATRRRLREVLAGEPPAADW